MLTYFTHADVCYMAQGVPSKQFFTHELTRNLYKRVVFYVLSRRNRITGRMYKDEPSIFGWELGNELFQPLCNDLRPPHCGDLRSLSEFPSVPLAWTQEMASLIRSIDKNHLIIAGGFVRDAQELAVAELDALGGSYYGDNTKLLLQNIATVGGQLPIVVKEFGLSGDSNLTVVQSVLQLLQESRAVAGGLYWSMRGHAREGGFYWHYEQLYDKESGITLYPQAIHFPGFDDSFPTYEISVIDMLTAANDALNTTSSTEAPLTPCEPTVQLLDTDAFPPCFSFIGSTGAVRYEIWVRPFSGIWGSLGSRQPSAESDPAEETAHSVWFRLMADAKDTVAERTSRMTFVDGDAVRKLMGYAGVDEPWQFCFQACSRDGLCSECSQPITILLNTTGTPSRLCSNTSTIVEAPRDEDYAQLGAIVLSLSPSPETLALQLAAVSVSGVSALLLLALLHQRVLKLFSSALNAAAKELNTDSIDLPDIGSFSIDVGSWRSQFCCARVCDQLLDPPLASACATGAQSLTGLRVLFVLAALLILFASRSSQLAALGVHSAGASAGLPLLFVLLGFEAFVKHAQEQQQQQQQQHQQQQQQQQQSAIGYACANVARMCPGVVVCSLLGFLLLDTYQSDKSKMSDTLPGEYLLLPLGLSAWIPSLRTNNANRYTSASVN